MKYYILDIETKANDKMLSIYNQNIKAPSNIKDPEKIALAIEKKKEESKKGVMVDTDYADILCIGVKEVGGEAKLYTPKEFETFFKQFSPDYPNYHFITYNGKAFDIPLLIKTGIKQNLDYPYRRLKDMTNKYQSNGCLDLMLEIGEYGKYKSLDMLLQIYCDIAKTPIDFKTASEDEIKKHCLEDLENTEKLYNKFIKIFK